MFLNTWGACLDGLVDYVADKSRSADVICLQEVHRDYSGTAPVRIKPKDLASRTTALRPKAFTELKQAMYETHDGYFAPQQIRALHDMEKTKWNVAFGNSMFVSNQLPMDSFEQRVIFGKLGDMYGETPAAKSMQVVTLQLATYKLVVAHFHGFWHEKGKVDMPERHQQNKNVLSMLQRVIHASESRDQPTHVLLGGDFNYTSEMFALKELVTSTCFGPSGGEHLNAQYGITDTRTRHYKKECREADHVITSQNFPVADFWLDYEAPSDHAALFVDFS